MTGELVPFQGPVALQGHRGALARVGAGHDGRGTDADRLAARLETISELHLLGYTYRDIAATVGISKSQVGREIVKIRELRAERTATNEQQRIEEQDAKLGFLERIALRAAVADPRFISAALAVHDRLARLHGWDKPSKSESMLTIEHTTTLDAEIASLMAELRQTPSLDDADPNAPG